jgi:hypothetical protein
MASLKFKFKGLGKTTMTGLQYILLKGGYREPGFVAQIKQSESISAPNTRSYLDVSGEELDRLAQAIPQPKPHEHVRR